MCFVMVVFVFVLFFFLVRDPFVLAHAIGALLYLCIHWSVQHKKKIKKKIIDAAGTISVGGDDRGTICLLSSLF